MLNLTLANVFVLDVQGAGPWIVFTFPSGVSSLSSFVLLCPPNPLLFLPGLGIREGKLCHAVSVSK